MPTSQPPRRPKETTPATPAACPWRARLWQEYRAGNVTRAERDVLLTLATYRGAGGIATPSHATLAERSRTSSRSVQRALDAARRLGLVRSQERRRRNGWRWLRTSDAHRLCVPETPVEAGQRPVFRRAPTTRHGGGGDEIQESKKAQLAAMLREAETLRPASEIATAAEARFAARWQAQRAARMGGRMAR